MKVSNQVLIEELIILTQKVIQEVKNISQMSNSRLNQKASPQAWSALECIEHLNYYSAFYIPEIEKVLNSATPIKNGEFKAGIIGNYFANSMKIKSKLNKMKTFRAMNPVYSSINDSVIQNFQNYQFETLSILEQAKKFNLRELKTNISISKLIKLRLGDTLRVLVYHNERHLAQAIEAAG